MDRSQFDAIISDALDSLPPRFADAVDNVEVVSELWPTDVDLRDGHAPPGSTLFGLYRGVPQTKRGNYNAVLPDKIIIFIGPMIAIYGDDVERLKQQIHDTVLHELGHHFGLSDEEIRKAGK